MNEIEEMAKIILQEPFLGGIVGYEERIAKRLIVAGYRKQKVGRWIKPSPFSDPVCSECKKSPKRVFGMLAPFCPNCGAMMEGDTDA